MTGELTKWIRIVLLILPIGQSGCGTTIGHTSEPALQADTPLGNMVVKAEVIHVTNSLASDGGVVVLLATPGGDRITMSSGHLYTSPRPSKEKTEMAYRLAKLKSGEWIKISGTATRKYDAKGAYTSIAPDEVTHVPSR